MLMEIHPSHLCNDYVSVSTYGLMFQSHVRHEGGISEKEKEKTTDGEGAEIKEYSRRDRCKDNPGRPCKERIAPSFPLCRAAGATQTRHRQRRKGCRRLATGKHTAQHTTRKV